ncbi:MAG: glycoside hydrolase family 3 N-terminal domain-containing protein [Verrucomicrobiota bacterium]
MNRFVFGAAKFTRSLPTVLLASFAILHLHAAEPTSASAQKAEALLQQMTLAEKIGQMTQVDSDALQKNPGDVEKLFLGSVLSGGNSNPANNSFETWRRFATSFQQRALQTRLKIPLLYGIDAVHGHNNVLGAVVFPHNIGLGATHNPALVERAARVTAEEIAATSMHWAFAPCVAVAQNIRWGRSYESFSSDPALVGQLGAAANRGFQAPLPGGFQLLACTKHFAGDGGTQDGIDQGNTIGDEAELRRLHLAPYVEAIQAGTRSIMVSYSSWNGQKMHGHKRLLTDVLKGELGFKGFLVSDWAAIDQLPGDYKSDVEASINAGLDMIMIPNGSGQKNNYHEFIAFLTELVNERKIPLTRIDDAVRRILTVKFEMGLFEHPYANPELAKAFGSPAHREVARECVRESLVVLQNEKRVLPLSKKLKHLAVIGKAADDLGIQCGGWTIDWQGEPGNKIPGGTTILNAIRKTVSADTKVVFSADATGLKGAEAVIVVVGEKPYAEMKGDRTELPLPAEDLALIEKAHATGAPVVTILLSGRPLVLGSALTQTEAFVAAWLPGTEGQGVADVLFGDYKPTGKLPRPWPESNAALANDVVAKPQFPLGYGLNYSTLQERLMGKAN